ncbi:E3 ubiquitin-protein ligase TRIM47 [Engraulis encrasicolus]|uniref:E3 ubiquitin-protein ligase TRIM47 n=1 Tax=Engraulis encrasicolus TaxID=184585 RepID=UPI002FD6DB95
MSGAKLWTEEQFNCPVCLDLPTDPVTIPCGHSYCMACISDFWTTEKTPGVYSCPECRQTFSPKPQLCRNTMLAEAMEQLRKGALSPSARETIRRAHGASVRASSNAKGPRVNGGGAKANRRSKGLSAGAVPCDQCLDGDREAIKTCMVCMASFCENHLKPHQKNAKLREHELIAPTGNLTEKICTQHKYLQEFYCRPCQTYICWLCTSNAHKGHESVSTQTQRTEKQKEVEVAQTQNQQRLQEREKELKDMKKLLETLTRSSEKVQEEVVTVLGELQASVQRLQDLVGEVMLTSGKEKVGETQDVVSKLEAEIKQLKKREKGMRDLVRCQDHIYFLQNFQELVAPVEEGDLASVTATPDVSFDHVKFTLLELRDSIEVMCNVELNDINKRVFDMVPFTVTKKDDQKNAFLKLFSGIGAKPANANRVPPTMPSVSVRGQGPRPVGNRNREEPRAPAPIPAPASSPRPPQRQTIQERDEDDTWSMSSMRSVGSRAPSRGERETANASSQPQSRQSRSRAEDRDDDTWSVSSVRPQDRQRRNNRNDGDRNGGSSQISSQPSQRQTQDTEQSDTWSISSLRPGQRQRREDREPAPRENTSTPAQNGQAQEQPRRQTDTWSLSSLRPRDRQRRESQQSERGERWSLSSLLPKNRRKREGTVRELTPDDPPSSSGLWDAQPTQVNPDLFLDLESMNPQPLPALREIDLDSIQAPEPRTREDFLQYACALTLDPNSAHRRLILSDGNTVATVQSSMQVCPDSAQRFDGWTQVVCVGPLPGDRCYWEVEWRGRGSSLGVCLASMPRKGADSRSGLGYNGQSWSLELSDMCCAALHDNQKQDIPVTYSPRVGLFLDRQGQTLAFYAVDDVELAPLHTFRSAALAQPLYAAFGVGCGLGVGLDFASGQFSAQTDSIKICSI